VLGTDSANVSETTALDPFDLGVALDRCRWRRNGCVVALGPGGVAFSVAAV
jgi:hypothetical protein